MNEKNTLSVRQMFVLFLLFLGVPSLPLLVPEAAHIGKTASWLIPLAGGLLFLPLFFLYGYLVRRMGERGLSEVFCQVLGKPVGMAVNVLYLLWGTLLCAFYLRQFGERIITTIFTETSIAVFLVVMLFAVLYTVKLGLKSIARAGTLFFFAIVAVYVICYGALSQSVETKNLTPVSWQDTLPVLGGGVIFTAILCYMVIFLFFSDNLRDRHRFQKGGLITVGVLSAFLVLAVAIPVGLFGHDTVSKMSFPFFAAAKSVSLFGTIERVEAAVVAALTVGDFVIVTLLAFLCLKLTSFLSGAHKSNAYANVFAILVFVLSLAIGSNTLELRRLYTQLILPVNLVMGVGIPILLLLTGKLRKKL